ncbi:hypothetical protein J6590_094602 [Homalodisca vitripennis]|nr:hypothetical protein J6590_094602 [Homalodisca vitripennis]
MSTLRAELRGILWLVDYLLDETPRDQSLMIAYALWREVRSSLEGLPIGIGKSMESAALRDPDDIDPEETEPSPPARHVRCCVCIDRLPTVGLRPLLMSFFLSVIAIRAFYYHHADSEDLHYPSSEHVLHRAENIVLNRLSNNGNVIPVPPPFPSSRR